jgi:class 3 adenylate cyclase
LRQTCLRRRSQPGPGVTRTSARHPPQRYRPRADDPEGVGRRISEFVNVGTEAASGATKQPTPPADSTLRTILFTNLVGHTEMMSRLGDERGRDVWHSRREALNETTDNWDVAVIALVSVTRPTRSPSKSGREGCAR